MLRTQNHQIEPQLNVAIYGYDVEEYVIIDDSSDFHVDQMSRFVRVDNRNGFDLTNFYDACRILKVNPYEVSGKWCKEEITQEEFKLCL